MSTAWLHRVVIHCWFQNYNNMSKTRPKKLINCVYTHPIIHGWKEAFRQLAGASASSLSELTHKLSQMKHLDCTHALLSALL